MRIFSTLLIYIGGIIMQHLFNILRANGYEVKEHIISANITNDRICEVLKSISFVPSAAIDTISDLLTKVMELRNKLPQNAENEAEYNAIMILDDIVSHPNLEELQEELMPFNHDEEHELYVQILCLISEVVIMGYRLEGSFS